MPTTKTLVPSLQGLNRLHYQATARAQAPDPYTLTVASDAVDDKCGAIVVSQPTHTVVVNVQCTIDPAIMTQVCRELRTGHRQITQEMSKMQDRFDLQLSTIQSDVAQLKELVVAGTKRPHAPETHPAAESESCQKRGCKNIVTERFANGKKMKQCHSCNGMAHRSKKKTCTY